MNSFRFKQFEVVQNFSAMRVNTDAVLLGAWMSIPQADGGVAPRMLDIGTGTGVIALMAGQRAAHAGTEARIEAVEIDAGACKDAGENFNAAPWKGIEFVLHQKSLQELSNSLPDKFDLVFTNPPYFIDSLKSSEDAKVLARHTDTLSQRELLFYSTPLLKEGGTLAIILPVVEGEELLRKVEFMADVAVAAGGDTAALFPSRICYVHTVERKPAKRLMLEFVKCAPSNRPTMRREQLVMMSVGAIKPTWDLT